MVAVGAGGEVGKFGWVGELGEFELTDAPTELDGVPPPPPPLHPVKSTARKITATDRTITSFGERNMSCTSDETIPLNYSTTHRPKGQVFFSW